MKPRRRMHGISFVEVAVALSIAGLLLGVAVPAAFSAYLRARYESVRLALSESVLMSSRVATASGSVTLLCPSDMQGRCRAGVDWSAGWLVYVDIDGDRAFGAYDVLLRRQPPLAEGIRLTSSFGRRQLAFQPDGSSSGSNLTFSLCSRASDRVELMVLSNTGRLRTETGSHEHRRSCREG